MLAVVYLLLEPWSLLHGKQRRLDFPLDSPSDSDSGKHIEIETLYRCLMVPDEMTVFIGDIKIDPGMQSNVFIWEGELFRRVLLPIELWHSQKNVSSSHIKLLYKDHIFKLTLISKHADMMQRELLTFLRWQINCFQELSSTSPSEEEDNINNHVVRRSWKNIQKFWLEDSNFKNEAPSNRIVRMARDQHLNQAFKQILKGPNKVLKRERMFQNIASVAEMDAGCLQWYLRQPGASPQEKAGPRQKILSVSRCETFDVLENRVTRWVVDTMLELSYLYLQENDLYKGYEKYNAVQRWERTMRVDRVSSPIKDVPVLCEHTFKPNFALTQHHHYRLIWNAYRELRSQQKLEEDCWKWQGILWCEIGRQLLGSLLTKLSSHSESFIELADSMVYIRREQMHGLWTDPPIAPGPFMTKEGQIDYIDLRDGILPEADMTSWMQALGCQQALRQYNKDGVERLIPIWFWHNPQGEMQLECYSKECLEAINISLPLLDSNSTQAMGILFTSAVIDGNSSHFTLVNEASLILVKVSCNFRRDLDVLESVGREIARFFEPKSLNREKVACTLE